MSAANARLGLRNTSGVPGMMQRSGVEHSRYDDKVFDWDEPPEGGHPGQAWNCRCYAEPYLPNEPPYVPDTGVAYWAARVAAEWDGTRDAAGDFVGQIIQSIEDCPGQMQVALRYLRLRTEEALGTLSSQEERELAEIRADIDTAIAGFKQFFRDAPELAADFASCVWATEARVALVGPPDRLMIDATHLKAHRTASSLLKGGMFPALLAEQKAG